MSIKIMLAVSVLFGVSIRGRADESKDYHVLCTNVIAALGDGKILTSPAFTNRMYAYLSEPSVEMRSMAELALSISRFSMFEKSQRTVDYEASCQFCSNVLYAADLPVRSWQKSVASMLYAGNLAMDGKYKCARTVCEAGLSVHLASPTTDVERAVWAAIAAHDLVPEISITNALNFAPRFRCRAVGRHRNCPLTRTDCRLGLFRFFLSDSWSSLTRARHFLRIAVTFLFPSELFDFYNFRCLLLRTRCADYGKLLDEMTGSGLVAACRIECVTAQNLALAGFCAQNTPPV